MVAPLLSRELRVPRGGAVEQEAGHGPVVRLKLCQVPLSQRGVLLQIVTSQEE